jgi:hypothetical protein
LAIDGLDDPLDLNGRLSLADSRHSEERENSPDSQRDGLVHFVSSFPARLALIVAGSSEDRVKKSWGIQEDIMQA